MKLCLYVNMAMICIFWQLNYMGMFAAQSKYLKHFHISGKKERERSCTKGLQMVGWQVRRDIHSIGNLKMEGGGLTKQ